MAREEENRDDDDNASDEEEREEEAGAEAEAAEAEAAEAPSAAAAKPAKKDTPGARLAAQKAAKAAAKAAKRGRAPDAVEAKVTQQAVLATDWVEKHKAALWAGLAAIVAISGGFVAWTMYSSAQAEAAATSLWDAVSAARAPIRAGGQAENADEETYESRAKRAEVALERFDTMLEGHGDTEAAKWARLGRAAELFELERYEDARAEYERVYADAGRDPILAWRSLEGLALSFEAEEKYDEAIEKLTQLGRESANAYKDIADYHTARIEIARNHTDRAKELLRELVGRLRQAEGAEGGQSMPFVLREAELRLQELDPSTARSAPSGGPGGPGGPGDTLDPAELQRLIQQLQEAQGGGGGGGPIQLPSGGGPIQLPEMPPMMPPTGGGEGGGEPTP